MAIKLSYLQIVILIDLVITLTTTVAYLFDPQKTFFDSLDVSWNGIKSPDTRNVVTLLFYSFQGRNLLVAWILFVALVSDKRSRSLIVAGIAGWCLYGAVVFYVSGFAHLVATQLAICGLVIFGCFYAAAAAMELRAMKKAQKLW